MSSEFSEAIAAIISCEVRKRIRKTEKSIMCETCGKVFVTQQNLSLHQRIHTGDKPYVCKTCSRAFKHRHHLLGHERIHTGEKPFVCKVCSKAFRTKEKLKIHERIHTGECPYICKVCNRAFNRSDNLKAHERIHTGEKCMHKIPVCGKQISRLSAMMCYQAFHARKETYFCELCNKTFVDQSHLTDHKTAHTSLRPYVCDVCCSVFKERDSLLSHQRIHDRQNQSDSKVKEANCSNEKSVNTLVANPHSNKKAKRIVRTIKPFGCGVCDEMFSEENHFNIHCTTSLCSKNSHVLS